MREPVLFPEIAQIISVLRLYLFPIQNIIFSKAVDANDERIYPLYDYTSNVS